MPKVLHIVQNLRNPVTKEELITGDRIEEVFQKYKSIREYAYILHDKDVYTKDAIEESLQRTKERYAKLSDMEKEKITEDEYIQTYHSWKKEGEPKPAHYHIVIRSDRNMDIKKVAKWFGIPSNSIAMPKGRTCFVDCVRYLVHETEKCEEQGKTRYSDDAVVANFDWRAMIEEENAKKEKYKSRSEKDYYRHMVLYEGMTLKEVMQENPDYYQDDFASLDKLRAKYLSEIAPMPPLRINFYLYGKGGVGKDLMSRGIARTLFPEIEADDDIFFVAGSGNVPFEGYDGQPVIIWSDRRAGGLLSVLGGRENFFNIFDTHPVRQRHNIKYGSVCLNNVVNIVNGQETFDVFLNGLAGEYRDKSNNEHKAEDKGQSYRRFPFIIPIRDNDFDLLINKGFVHDDRSLYREYYAYRNIQGNLTKLIPMCEAENSTFREASAKILSQVSEEYNKVIENKTEDTKKTKEDIMTLIDQSGWGKQKEPEREICVVRPWCDWD